MQDHQSSQESQSLFRPESIKAARSLFGSPLPLSGIPEWCLTFFFASLFSVAIYFVCNTNYARRETVSGQVTAIEGTFRVVAPRQGHIQDVFITEGQSVRIGQELIVASYTPRLELGESVAQGLQANHEQQMAAQTQQVNAKREQIRRQREETLVRQKGVKGDLYELFRAHELQTQRVVMQERTISAMTKLAEQGLLAKVTLSAKEEELIAARQNAASIERDITRQKNLDEQLTSQLNRLNTDEKAIQTDGSAVKLQMAEKRLNTRANYEDHLVSPIDGVVTALQAKTGTHVNGGQTLAVVVPHKNLRQPLNAINQTSDELEVELWAPSRAIGFVKPGDKVRIMYDSFPYQNFGVGIGNVRDVAHAPTLPSDLPTANTNRDQLFRIRVRLASSSLNAYGKTWPLSPGMTLNADLVLEERTLLDWLLEPLFALKKRSV